MLEINSWLALIILGFAFVLVLVIFSLSGFRLMRHKAKTGLVVIAIVSLLPDIGLSQSGTFEIYKDNKIRFEKSCDTKALDSKLIEMLIFDHISPSEANVVRFWSNSATNPTLFVVTGLLGNGRLNIALNQSAVKIVSNRRHADGIENIFGTAVMQKSFREYDKCEKLDLRRKSEYRETHKADFFKYIVKLSTGGAEPMSFCRWLFFATTISAEIQLEESSYEFLAFGNNVFVQMKD
jgi:hypothetical protein